MKFLELNGEIIGIVESEGNETLLIRKGHLTFFGKAQVFLATEKAVFVKKELLNQYWIKLLERSYVVETVNIDTSRRMIREFFNM